MIKTLTKYLRVWRLIGSMSFQSVFLNRWSAALFFVAKSLRLAMSLVFLWLIKTNVSQFANYTSDQMIVFFLTSQVVDQVTQILFRQVYMFGNLIRTGEFDFYLLRPISTLFRSLFGWPDWNDILFFGPSTLVIVAVFLQLDVQISLGSLVWYCLLLLNAVLIAASAHILIISLAIIAVDVDGLVWLYRDLFGLGRFPITIYAGPLRWLLFFVVPIGMMITIPTEVLLGLPPTHSLALASAIGLTFFVASYGIWRLALKKYGSASS